MRGFQAEWRIAFCIRDGFGLRSGFGISTVTAVARIENVDVAGDLGVLRIEARPVRQVHIVVVDERLRDRHKRHVAGESPIVEPVDADRGNAVDKARGVHRDDYEVRSRMQDGRDFTIERRVAALVIAYSFLVDPNMGAVVGGTDVQEFAPVRLGCRMEVALVPDHSLIVEELRHLRVPVSRHLKCGRG